MNKYLIIVVILILILFSGSNENMKAKVFLNTSYDMVKKDIDEFLEDIENVTNENLSSKDSEKEFDEFIKNLPKEKTKEKFDKSKFMIWENNLLETKTVKSIIKKAFIKAKFNKSIFKEIDYLVKFINSRKELIKFLPQINEANKITYSNIKNLIKDSEPSNYINISSINKKLPVYMKPYNFMIVNNVIYNYTPYGVIKYIYKTKRKQDNYMINAILEATNINKINKYNSKEGPIFNFRGKLLQNIENEIYNLETGKKFNLDKALNEPNYWERNTNIIPPKIIEKFTDNKKKSIKLKNLLYILNKGPKSYLVYPNKIIKDDEFSSKINKVIKENNLTIFGVVSKYNFNKNLKYSTLFLCNDNLYFSVSKNFVSQVKDFKKDYGFSISKKIPNYLSCQDQKIIFNQMIKENILNKNTSDKMLKKLKCKI